MLVSTSTRRAIGWSAKGLLPLALPATVIVVTIIARRRRRKPTVAAAAEEAAVSAVSVPEQGAIDFDGGPIVSDAAAEAVASVQPLPLVVADERFPVSLARLVRTTLQPEAPFIQRHFGNMGYWATVIEPWALDTDKRLTRRISYTTPLKKNSLGPSTADCVEQWHLQAWTADAFVVSVEARTPMVPYGGAFHQELLFIGTAEGASSCRLQISCQVVFDKRVFGIGGIIRSSSEAGMKETYAAYAKLLQEYFLHPQSLAGASAVGGKLASEPGAGSSAPAACARLDGSVLRLVRSDAVLRTSLLALVAAVLWTLLWQRWLLARSVTFQAAFQQAC